MARQKYKLNTESLDFEIIKIPLRHKTQRFLALFFVSIILFFVYAKIYSHFFENPKIILLKNKNSNIQFKYNLLLRDVENADKVITAINNRDENVYRTIFGLDKISYSPEKQNFNLPKSELMRNASKTFIRLDNFRHKVYRQSKSFDEIAQYAANVEKMASSMPAIPPLDLRKMLRIGHFGMRSDPFTGEPRFHAGCDLVVPTGTPIYATGEGIVVKAYYSATYGQTVDIDHGFGYLTRYAHLSEMFVTEGEKVVRGQEIALAGSTGIRSTGPHLHYEVRFRDMPQNPIKFFVLKQTDINYTEIINNARKDGYMEIR